MSFNRRRFLSRSGLLAASSLIAPAWSRGQAAVPARPGQTPRHIIHLMADGLSSGTLTCAELYSQLIRNRSLAWMELYRAEGACLASVNMRSLNSVVTDSAAAASAWGGGSRVVNGALNYLPDGRALRPLCTLLGEQGWQRGLVTTTEITHASPAGFAASGIKRDDAQGIALQYYHRGLEVLLGGGKQFFDPAKRKDKRKLLADFRDKNYVVLETAAHLEKAATDRPWLGLFASSHLPHALDRKADPKGATIPSLPMLARRALQRLESADHFFLMIEGGLVDQACHNCDLAAAMHEMIELDEALTACLEFQRRHPDTLIVVTADHGTGNPGLNGSGSDYGDSGRMFARLAKFKCSVGQILKRLGKTPTVAEAQKVIADATGYSPSTRKTEALLAFINKQGWAMYEGMNSVPAQLGQMLANHVSIGWTGTAHTADFVPLVAHGPGAERFRGFLQNTDLFRHYTELAGIDFRNPELPLAAGAGLPDEAGEALAVWWEAEAAHETASVA